MKYIFAYLFIFSSYLLVGQVEIGNQTFPVAGDTLNYAIDATPEIQLSTAGENQDWNFSQLKNSFETQEIYLNASEGMASNSYPDADLVMIIGENNERYFSVEENCIEEVALIGNMLFGGFFMGSTAYDDPPKFRRAPINYGDTFVDEVRFSLAFDSEEIPDTLLNMLPIVPDSIRVGINATVNDTVDSWGTLHIPGKSLDALRIKSTTTFDVILEVKVFIWFPIDLSQIEGADSLLNLLPQTSYRFVGNEDKEILTTLTLNAENQVTNVQYKNTSITSATEDINFKEQVSIFPNPASEILQININESIKISGFKILNINGMELYQSHPLNSRHIDLNISGIPPGMYVIQYLTNGLEFVKPSRFVKL